MPLAGFTTHTSAHGHTNPSLRNQSVRAEMLFHMVRQAYRKDIVQVKSSAPTDPLMNLFRRFLYFMEPVFKFMYYIFHPLGSRFQLGSSFRGLGKLFLEIGRAGHDILLRRNFLRHVKSMTHTGPPDDAELCQCGAVDVNLRPFAQPPEPLNTKIQSHSAILDGHS